jgi:hypothetical protein
MIALPDRMLGQGARRCPLRVADVPCVPCVKEPTTRHGFHDAGTDPHQTGRWWNRCRDARFSGADQARRCERRFVTYAKEKRPGTVKGKCTAMSETCVVFGGSSGIGEATALCLLRTGRCVVVVGRDAAKLASLAWALLSDGARRTVGPLMGH